MADHRKELPSGWLVWKWIELRSAGFSAEKLLRLASPATAQATDHLSAARETAVRTRARLLAEIESLPRSKEARRAVKKLRRGNIPDRDVAELSELSSSLDAFAAAKAAVAQAEREAVEIYQTEDLSVSSSVREIAGDSRFREAITWQNRRAVRTALDRVRAKSGPPNANTRQKQHLVASYLQRYCAKNDAIGFFGPHGFGRLANGDPALVARPGPTLLTKRTVYFEFWCVDTLARTLGSDPALKPFARPRRLPTIWLDDRLHYGFDQESEVSRDYIVVLGACDGKRPARQIARELADDDSLDLCADDVLEILGELEEVGLCTWTFEIPIATFPPASFESHLRELLVEAGPNAERGIEILDEFELRRANVEQAAGDPDALDRTLEELESTFERVTDVSAHRRAGQTYAGRTLVYEECRRDVELAIGGDLLDRIDAPLSLLLAGARWFTHRVAGLYREALERTFNEIAGSRSTASYIAIWQAMQPHFPAELEAAPLVVEASEELQQRWAELVGLRPGGPRRLELAATDLAPRVAEVFDAPGPGWPNARYHTPDLMLAARSLEEVCRGDGFLVLGELHPSVNTIDLVAQREHDETHELIRARELDIAEVVPTPVFGRKKVIRGEHIWLSRHNVDVELGSTSSWRPRDHVVAIADLVVARQDGRLVVRDRAGRWSFDPIVFFDLYLTALVAPEYRMFPSMAHRPRISIGGLVVAREEWRFDPGDLEFSSMPRGVRQFEAARGWAAQHQMPRMVFARFPEETKPMYVDFASPLYVEILSKLIRRSSAVTISEMLPNLEQTWLVDHDARTYTSELRLVMVDPQSWQPPGEP